MFFISFYFLNFFFISFLFLFYFFFISATSLTFVAMACFAPLAAPSAVQIQGARFARQNFLLFYFYFLEYSTDAKCDFYRHKRNHWCSLRSRAKRAQRSCQQYRRNKKNKETLFRKTNRSWGYTSKRIVRSIWFRIFLKYMYLLLVYSLLVYFR